MGLVGLKINGYYYVVFISTFVSFFYEEITLEDCIITLFYENISTFTFYSVTSKFKELQKEAILELVPLNVRRVFEEK